jgi:hypothetical protein
VDKRTEADIDLDYPITVDGETIKVLKMRRPKVRDSLKQNRSKSNDFEKGLTLIADLVERPVEVLEELDEVELEKLQKQYMAFTGRQDDTTPKA